MTTATMAGPPPGAPRLVRDVAPGVHRLEHAHVNCYLVEGDTRAEGVTLVDTALPATWGPLQQALEAIGREPDEVRAAVLTHAHFDHLGMASRLIEEWDVPIWGHMLDEHIAQHPYRYAHAAPRVVYPFRYPSILPILGRMIRAGALWVRGITGLLAVEEDHEVPVPGRPSVVFTPGHTDGHCALLLADRDAILTGDALVTLNPYTGDTGPQVVSAAATADVDRAFASLPRLAATGARTVLPGHGEPWRGGIESAVTAAVAYGRS